MNNNCTKCGNPLQAGTTICPVCGTNNINAVPAAQPVPGAPAVGMAPQAAPAPGAPVGTPLQATQQVPVPPAPGMPAAPAQPAPVPGVAPVEPAHAVAPMQATQQVPVTPAAPEAPAAPAAPEAPAAPAKEKKPINKKLFIILGAVAAVVVIGVVLFIFVFNKSEELEPTPEPSTSNNLTPPTAQSSSVTLNGFTFKVPNGWQTTTSNGDVSVYDSSTSTIVSFLTVTGSIDSINEDQSKNYLVSRGFANVEYQKTSIQGKDVVFIKATMEGSSFVFEFYYMNGDMRVVGASVVHADSEASNKNKRFVEEIMGSLSYSDSVNALANESVYNDAKDAYTSILGGNSGSYDNSTNEENVDNNTDNSGNDTSNSGTEESDDNNGGF